MIALVDYGAGNLTSVRKALTALGAEFATPAAPDDLATVAGIIVPGVGHFGATRALDETWRRSIRHAVDRGAALFGICLGMQWLFEGSEEASGAFGLGCFSGVCQLLRADVSNSALDQHDLRGPSAAPIAETDRGPAPLWKSGVLKVPHVGWNSLEMPRASSLLDGIGQNAQVYFTHSYVAPVVAETAAVTTYGQPFTAAVERGRIAGVQFHPEKSGEVGLEILKNWLEMVR